MKVLRMKDVIAKLGLSRSTIYNLINAGDFPPSFRLHKQSVGWLESDIDEWILKRMAENKKRD